MKTKDHELPEEWINLIKEAMKSNVTKEDFIKFLKDEKKKRNLEK